MTGLSLSQLIRVDDPAWPEVDAWIRGSVWEARVLEPDISQREPVMLALQNTLRAPLGAMVWHTGGLVVDHGWLRVLGSGGSRLDRSVLSWAQILGWWDGTGGHPPAVVIAEDVLGGLFALNWGGIDPGSGLNEVFYFGPDTLRWEPLRIGYTHFLHFVLGEQLARFYEHLRWPGWEAEIGSMGLDRGLSVWPPPWSREGKEIGACSRRPVPIGELVSLHFDFGGQLGSGQ